MATTPEASGGEKGESLFRAILKTLPTPMVIAVIGMVSTHKLEQWKDDESNVRLYTELMSRREESDNALRKDMFAQILQPFVQQGGASLDSRVLNLELLVQNIHESFELGPLFKDLMRQIAAEPDASRREKLTTRIEVSARDVRNKQLFIVQEAGAYKVLRDITLPVDDVVTLDPIELTLPGANGIKRRYQVTLEPPGDPVNGDVRVNLLVMTLERGDGKPVDVDKDNTNVSFDLGQFDFPMIRNTRLSDDQRFAIVVNGISREQKRISLTFVCFPGTRASLREMPYVDEILEKLRGVSANR